MLRKNGRKAVAPWSPDQINALGERLREVFASAASWQELEEALEAFGGTLMPKGQGMIVTDRSTTGFAKLSSLGEGIRLREMEKRFGDRWQDYAPSRSRDQTKDHQTRPLVTEMDVVLGLYRIGLADRADVQKAADERERRVTTLPVAKQIEREMVQALRSARKLPMRKVKQPSPSYER